MEDDGDDDDEDDDDDDVDVDDDVPCGIVEAVVPRRMFRLNPDDFFVWVIALLVERRRCYTRILVVFGFTEISRKHPKRKEKTTERLDELEINRIASLLSEKAVRQVKPRSTRSVRLLEKVAGFGIVRGPSMRIV